MLLSAHDFLMRRFRQTRYAFCFGFALTGPGAGFVAMMLMHLFLSFVKIEFVQARAGADLVSLDVPCLIFHIFFLNGARTLESFLPLTLGPSISLAPSL
jgi:hypothetical protein